MKSKRILMNIVITILLQMVVFLSGFIIKNLVVVTYGSVVNGMFGSIDQIITSLSVLEAGIGSATVVSLYRPLVEKDHDGINRIMNTANFYYKRTGLLYSLVLFVISFIYPRLIADQFDVLTMQLLIFIMAAATLLDYFFYAKYRIMLEADQRNYVLSSVQILTTLLSTLLTIGLIFLRWNFVLIKVVVGLMAVLKLVLVLSYVRRTYPFVKIRYSKRELVKLHQRGATFVHQICGIIVNNTDLLIITMALPKDSLKEASVYGIYYMIAAALLTVIHTITTVFTAGFGHLLVTATKERIKAVFQEFELLSFIVVFVVYSCLAILYLPFIGIYTKNFTDAIYYRPQFAYLFVGIGLMQTIRIPGVTVIAAAGHFKETMWRAVVEFSLNLIVSLLLVQWLGVIGVLIGTLLSFLYRSTDIIIYNAKKLIPGTLGLTVWRIVKNTMAAVLFVGIMLYFRPAITGYGQWILYAISVGAAAVAVFGAINLATDPSAQMVLKRLKRMID